MSLLVVGLSHRSAPLPLLERTSLSSDAAGKLLDDVVAAPAVDEAMLLSTCNRVELYASVEKFHAGVAALSELLARHTGVGFDELSPHVYVHYEDRAAQHLFAVTSSLDSMLDRRTPDPRTGAGCISHCARPRRRRKFVARRHPTGTACGEASACGDRHRLSRHHLDRGRVAPRRAGWSRRTARGRRFGAGSMASIAVAALRSGGCR